jgi:hypothetical protein
MATVTCYRYEWLFAEGLRPGTNYYGYIKWDVPPVLVLQGTVTITAAPGGGPGGKITVLGTSVYGTGPGTSGAEFTIRNDGNATITTWTIFMSIVQP